MRKSFSLIGWCSVIIANLGSTLMCQNTSGTRQDSVLNFDFPEMKIGIAEYDNGPTGTTVFYFPQGVMGAADVRGGSTGTLNALTVMNGYESKMINAVVFSGGSWYGLSAATGVANEIKDMKAEEGNFNHISGVLGGIIYDVGHRRFSRITPDDKLGRQAVRDAKPNSFPLGAKGAGRFAMQGAYYNNTGENTKDRFASWAHSGQGAAFSTIGETKIGVFTVVNSLGTIVNRKGRLVRCHRNLKKEDCPTIEEFIRERTLLREINRNNDEGPTNNTTLTLVVTNQKLPFWALQRLATQVHTSMGRAIQPFSTQYDGDVLYAVTTNEVENTQLSPTDLSLAASELAWDAVLNSVPVIPETPEVLQKSPDYTTFKSYEGDYEFYGGGKLNVKVEAKNIVVQFNGNGLIYFDRERKYKLIPAKNDLFLIDSPAQDVIRFDESNGTVTGLTLNPGPWSNKAERK